jgi:hypothetical protein
MVLITHIVIKMTGEKRSALVLREGQSSQCPGPTQDWKKRSNGVGVGKNTGKEHQHWTVTWSEIPTQTAQVDNGRQASN